MVIRMVRCNFQSVVGLGDSPGRRMSGDPGDLTSLRQVSGFPADAAV